MNDLNSVLIEGKINGEVETKTTDGETVCSFWIASNWFLKTEKGYDKETSFFKIETTGKLTETVIKDGCDNRRIRVVGRLKQKRWEKNGNLKSEVVIIPEHIGFNPMFKK
jgi:single-strand DNA-binding protein